jgi:hypothetical protein
VALVEEDILEVLVDFLEDLEEVLQQHMESFAAEEQEMILKQIQIKVQLVVMQPLELLLKEQGVAEVEP